MAAATSDQEADVGIRDLHKNGGIIDFIRFHEKIFVYLSELFVGSYAI